MRVCSVSEWGSHPISPEFWDRGITEYRRILQGRNTLHNTTSSLYNTTPALHRITHSLHNTTNDAQSASHWGHKPDLGQAKVTTTLLFTGWRCMEFSAPQANSLSFPRLPKVSSTGLQTGNRIHTVQEGSHARTTNHSKNYLVIEWTHWHWRQHQLMTPQVTQSSDSGQHHTMTSTSEGPGPRGQVSATRKVKADTMHQWSEQQSSGLQCPYLDMATWQNEEGATLSTMCNTHCAHHTVPFTGQPHHCTPPSHPSYSRTHTLYTHTQ